MSDESERIVGLYERHAQAWAQGRRGPHFETPWLDRFLALLPEAAPILDIGCGAGEPIAGYFIRRGHEVTGVDSAPSLIALCRERLPAGHWQVADMRTLTLDRTFAGIIAWDSFFHLTPQDQRAMFPVFGAHAAPGAALMFTSGPGFGEAIGSFGGEPLYHASLDAAEYRELLAGQGFEVVSHVVEDRTCGGHTIWLARRA